MEKNNLKKADQLGMPVGTASARLRKSIIFSLIKKSGENFCFQCGGEIESEKELSIEHKIPYLDSEDPKKLFFDLDNIAFSHLSCNVGARRRDIVEHSINGYRRRGCRCNICKSINAKRVRNWRNRKMVCSSKVEHETDTFKVEISKLSTPT